MWQIGCEISLSLFLLQLTKINQNYLVSSANGCTFVTQLKRTSLTLTTTSMEKMKANAENLFKALTHLINRYNRNMGYTYSVEHNEFRKQIEVVCNPTNAVINDVSMVADAFINLNEYTDPFDKVVEVFDIMPLIIINYRNKRFRAEVDTFHLQIVGAVED